MSTSNNLRPRGNTLSYPQYPSQQPYPPQQQSGLGGEPPLWAPYYGAPFPAAVQRFFKKYTAFSGRASRSEYWWWTLAAVGVSIVLNIISAVTASPSSTGTGGTSIFGTILLVIWGLATIIPSLALTVRRLHDGNFSGWLLLLVLIPFLGALAVLIFTLMPANPAGQRFDQPTA